MLSWPCVSSVDLRASVLLLVGQGLLDAALAAQKDRLALDHDLDRQAHRAEPVAFWIGQIALGLGQAAGPRGSSLASTAWTLSSSSRVIEGRADVVPERRSALGPPLAPK